MSDLERLFRPRSIAVVGGGIWGANVINRCRDIGYTGDIWPIHPTKDEIAGVRAFRHASDLPSAPDAAFVGVNRNATIDVVRDLREIGTHGAVCFAAGFREARSEDASGHDLQQDLLDAAGDMRIIGPNCYGFINYLDGAALWPDQHGGARVDGGVAIVTQSSNIANNLTMQRRGLPIAYIVTAGNQAQTGLSEISLALIEDPRVTALGLHIEGVDDLRDFEALAARARGLGKPIVALKVGKSDQAQAATNSHTASLAGSDVGARALLDRVNIAQVSSLSGLLETLKLMHMVGPLASNRIASISCSGGEASLMADAAHDTGLEYPPVNERQQQDLRAVLGPLVALANPLDYHTYIWGNEPALIQAFTAMMDPDHALGVVVLDFPRADRCQAIEWEDVVRAVAATREACGMPMAILASVPENMPEHDAQRLMAMGIVPLAGIPEAMEAIGNAVKLGKMRGDPAPLLLPGDTSSDGLLSEAEAKAALAGYGVRIPQARRVEGVEAAAVAAAEIGFPVVLKGEGVAHKTEAGAVALNLSSPEAVTEAGTVMPSDTFLVEEMVTGTVAELLIGIVRDPAHGYVLTVAAGGTLTELLKDSASLLVPADADAVTGALMSLKIAPLLSGYRGAAPADMGAIIDTVMALQAYVTDHPVDEIEINPLMCGPNGAIAADALIKGGGTR